MGQEKLELDLEVDELLASSDPQVETTGVYDVSFFQHLIPEPRKSGLDSLEDARVGLGLFLEEAMMALETCDLTVDQRLHVATILSYVDGLAQRFDTIKVPGFTQKKHR